MTDNETLRFTGGLSLVVTSRHTVLLVLATGPLGTERSTRERAPRHRFHILFARCCRRRSDSRQTPLSRGGLLHYDTV